MTIRKATAAGDPICILFCIDRAYLRQAGVTLGSILEHNPTTAFEVYVAGFDRDPAASEAIFARLAARHGSCTIRYADLEEGLFADLPVTRQFSASIYTRIVLDRFIDRRHGRVLYLDADTVVRSDLHGLWTTPLEGYVLAAVQDHFRLDSEAIGFAADEPYFNSGVLLINMHAWRAEACEGRVLAYLGETGRDLPWMDQDALNVVLRGRVRFLDLGWNFQPRCADVPAGFLGLTSAAYAALRADPYLIHYTTSQKPWNAAHRVHYSRDFFAAARTAGLGSLLDAPPARGAKERLDAVKTRLRWHFPSIFRAFRRLLKPEAAAMMYRARAGG
ncbi:glycosyltransferase family 8 protein [Methylobacterium sp. J-059]|uniref:glycosyltransferase family 8 protein n=1 Tax=Methylobacterium sp. J-059 TaxID=2836643 RepID=UPI001FB9470D|nr:glycosyltransferase family 8 protein [Methylobacterium sp. J-059]MCJ2038556.1 glycosyltransferase family 8 protein [Methylobacterium sp. J-059]